MSTTSYGVNDALAIKLWSKKLDHEALKYTDIGPLIGDDPDSVIHRKTETQKGPGDQVTYAIRMQLSGAGFTENQLAEGNGESLTTYSDKIVINELGHVVGVKSEYTIDQQRVPFDLREEAKGGLADWYAKRFSVAFFNQVCGNTVQNDTRFTGLNATIAATRIIRQSARASDDLLVAGDTFTLNLIDKAKELAITATPKIRPAKFAGGSSGGGMRRACGIWLGRMRWAWFHPSPLNGYMTTLAGSTARMSRRRYTSFRTPSTKSCATTDGPKNRRWWRSAAGTMPPRSGPRCSWRWPPRFWPAIKRHGF